MIIHDAEQGTDEWHQARLGVVTASQFHRLITKVTLKPSGQADAYLSELIAAWLIDEPLEGASSGYLLRGKVLEAQAREWYEIVRDADVAQVGLCLTDDGSIGASPDGLIGDDGLIEIKCPAPKTHAAYLLGTIGFYDAHCAQVQGALWITERQWADLVSYHPTMPPVIVRCERSESFIAALAPIVESFAERVAAAKSKLTERAVKLSRAE